MCTLAASGAEDTAACEVAYTPKAVGSGEHKITASYNPGETLHEPKSGQSVLKVALRVPTVTVSCGPSDAVLVETTCTFTVADEGEGAEVPKGSVKPAPGLHGTFASPTCALELHGATEATCSIKYTPKDTSSPSIEATYEPTDVIHEKASGSAPLPVTKRQTTVSLNCGTAVFAGQAAACTATVTDISPGTGSAPEGSVSFTSDTAGGSFAPASVCKLTEVHPSESSCLTTYTPGQAGSGTHLITAKYEADSFHEKSQGETTLPVGAVTQPQPPAPPSPPAVTTVPKCHLVVTSQWRSVPNPRKRRRKITVPVLLVNYTCDQSATVRINGIVTVPAATHGRVRTKARKVALAAVSAKSDPGVAEPAVVLRLPTAVVNAVKGGSRAPAAVTFTVQNANGMGAATLKVVVAPRRKHG